VADEPDYQAMLDQPTPPAAPDHRQMLQAIGVAFSDALGPYGEQPELRSRWEREQDRGRRLQVVGHIDLATLERQVAGRVLELVARYAGVELEPIPGESFDDL
jgi:hypothetical protein